MQFVYNKLKGKIKEVFGTQRAFATALGISYTALNSKLNNYTEFTQSEIINSCKLLNIHKKGADEYFFDIKVRKTEQSEGA